MLEHCEHCERETEQELLKKERSSNDDILLTTYRCRECNNKHYGAEEKKKDDLTNYPMRQSIPPEKLEQAIINESEWKPYHREFKIEGKKYFISEYSIDDKIVFEQVSKEEYDEEKFQQKFQLRLYDALKSPSISTWEYPPKYYQINEECGVSGHDFSYKLEFQNQFGIETYPKFLDDPDMVFVGSKRESCDRCEWNKITVFPEILRKWYFQKKLT